MFEGFSFGVIETDSKPFFRQENGIHSKKLGFPLLRE